MVTNTSSDTGKYKTAASRWAGVGPYYAMFPVSFADYVVDTFTKPGDHVFDPFSGRATSIFSAATKARFATGIEINPVGWIYGQVKLSPASEEQVSIRLQELSFIKTVDVEQKARALPEFFHHCFSQEVLQFLVTARTVLDWRCSKVDRTLMAFILIHLHGKREASLSNQMRQSKAMSPEYSIRWWSQRNILPPKVEPVSFLLKRLRWRYSKGIPGTRKSKVFLGDSCIITKQISDEIKRGDKKPMDLLLTSPPYYGVTNYFVDQWLRLWMLGFSERPTKTGAKYQQNGFESKASYEDLLKKVFESAAGAMSSNGVVYIRTDARKFTFDATYKVLEKVFADWNFYVSDQPYSRSTQTALYGDKSQKPGEKDIVLTGPER